jgi:hypothetical protein
VATKPSTRKVVDEGGDGLDDGAASWAAVHGSPGGALANQCPTV